MKYVCKFLNGCIQFFICYKAFCLCDRKATHVLLPVTVSCHHLDDGGDMSMLFSLSLSWS